MRFKDIDLEQLPTFVEGADAYHKPNDQTRLWGWGDGSWCLLRAGDSAALFWEEGDSEPGLREPVRESECDHVARLFAECERQQAVATAKRLALEPGKVPSKTAQAWAEIIHGAVWADPDSDVDMDDVVLELLDLGFPEPVLELVDWTRGARAVA